MKMHHGQNRGKQKNVNEAKIRKFCGNRGKFRNFVCPCVDVYFVSVLVSSFEVWNFCRLGKFDDDSPAFV